MSSAFSPVSQSNFTDNLILAEKRSNDSNANWKSGSAPIVSPPTGVLMNTNICRRPRERENKPGKSGERGKSARTVSGEGEREGRKTGRCEGTQKEEIYAILVAVVAGEIRSADFRFHFTFDVV